MKRQNPREVYEEEFEKHRLSLGEKLQLEILLDIRDQLNKLLRE